VIIRDAIGRMPRPRQTQVKKALAWDMKKRETGQQSACAFLHNGYSGHLSYILHMLDTPRFMQTYLAGESKPEGVMAFGQSHRIVINKMVV